MGGYWQLVFACCLLVRSLSAEYSVKDNSTSAVKDNSTSVVKDNSTSAVNSDEELKKNIGQRIASLQEMQQDEIRNFADLALQHYNTQKSSLFTTLEEATVTVKKAIGSMVYLRMTLEKTNCTKKDVKHHSLSHSDDSDDSDEGPPKYCSPLDGQNKEQLDCKFDIFKNERSYDETVMSHDCKPVKIIDKAIFLGEEFDEARK
ncbi:uncharacterized protein LOC113423829 [Notechis scutatus]|uniref:Uncharacterized protein LOC113423829 n=1 Tax=Notechis scutatus TaxID=8663 RepID=A0A6J1VMF5_9SAUR|nr:uncharacterized protein LOC113423829 [Notechis scutatus]